LPRIWDDEALKDWATPIAALGIRPGHFTAAEYYAVPGDNLRTYPVYRPDREPPGYWEWLQKQRPEPLVDASKIRTREDWIKAGKAAFQDVDRVSIRSDDAAVIRAYRDPAAWEDVWTRSDGSLLMERWVVTSEGLKISFAECAGCHGMPRPDGAVLWGAPLARSGAKRGFTLPTGLRPASVGGGSPLFEHHPLAVALMCEFSVPWKPDDRIEDLANASETDR